MRITSLRLRNFKRFSDLSIKDIPESARLVVVVGPNGSGKSSLFDALIHWHRIGFFGLDADLSYFRKNATEPHDWNQTVDVTLAHGAVAKRDGLYIRTAYRNDPDFSTDHLGRLPVPSEALRIARSIQNDQTVAENYQRLILETMSGVYDTANDAMSVAALRAELIGQLRSSMQAVFGDLSLNNISNPLSAGSFFFDKGVAKSYHYKNLSGGGKAAFDLLLDFHIKKKFYPDAIYGIDEIETHLHTRIQGRLLREIVNVMPEASQLWVTTHSLGVLRAAHEMSVENPGTVCLLDFDIVDPDEAIEIAPTSIGRVAWEKMLSITLDDLSQRIAPRVVVVCEGSSIGNRRKDFDADIYNRILASQTPDIIFVSGGSAAQVAVHGISIRQTLSNVLQSAKIVALCDRDDKSTEEVVQFESQGNIVLPDRNIESFLFSDDVIGALAAKENKSDLLLDALKIKSDAIAASISRGNASNDIKSAAGEIYTKLKQLFSLQGCGNNTDTFMRDTLAPLVTPSTATYIALKRSIVDRLP